MASILPDSMLIAIASNDAFHLGVLSSNVHESWALAQGATLEDRPRDNKSRCFETFPFPQADTSLTITLRQRTAQLAERTDAFRKEKLALAQSGKGLIATTSETSDPTTSLPKPLAEPAPSGESPPSANPAKPAKDLALTGLYNVLQALREGRPLNPKEKQIQSAGLVGVLKTLHNDLDAAVLQAYGWADLQAGLAASPLSPEFAAVRDELLARLVALNAQRTAEEAQGQVRWLQPEFQNSLSKQ